MKMPCFQLTSKLSTKINPNLMRKWNNTGLFDFPRVQSSCGSSLHWYNFSTWRSNFLKTQLTEPFFKNQLTFSSLLNYFFIFVIIFFIFKVQNVVCKQNIE